MTARRYPGSVTNPDADRAARRDRARHALGALLLGIGACTATAPAATSSPRAAGPPATAQPDTPQLPRGTRALSAREREVMTELMRAAERVRQLRFLRPVPSFVQNAAAIRGFAETQIEDEQLERARIVYIALGLLPADVDVRSMLLGLLEEQIVGYYDQKERRMVVRDDIMRELARSAGSETEAGVLLHELVHALQDQHMNLGDEIERDRDTDAAQAYQSLIEGDAMLAMYGHVLAAEGRSLRSFTSDPFGIGLLTSAMEQMQLADSELTRAPPIVRETLLSPYVDGLRFAAHLHAQGDWRALDRAHRHPPRSTEHVLHPARYERGEEARDISLPELAWLGDPVEEDTLGELELRIYFQQALDIRGARRAADGWNGDRLRVYRRADGATPVVWLTAWDSEAEAREAERAAQSVRRGLAARERRASAVLRNEQRLLVLRHVEPRWHEKLRRSLLASGNP